MNTTIDSFENIKKPNEILTYFKIEWRSLLIVTITGLVYNIGMIAGPWFEGQLVQTLCEIIQGTQGISAMITLAVSYVLTIALVQFMRYEKRFYVRRFGNNINRNMKRVLYRNMISKTKQQLEGENIGSLMTKAISDADTCAEGMRKFTTEIFDTGVVMVAYLSMLLYYDWHLALICLIFPPFAYVFAQLLKRTVSKCAFALKESTGKLNAETLDRVSNSMTYRVLSEEENRNGAYESRLSDYEKKAVASGVIENAMQPIYQIISMISVIFILWLGSKNVLGTGEAVWNIAAFTTFLSCFTKLALKSSKAAKLFNSVQKAAVSWQRIKPFMNYVDLSHSENEISVNTITVKNADVFFNEGLNILENICFSAKKGQIIGVTGPVACGKSAFGKLFIGEAKYSGEVKINQSELSDMTASQISDAVCYMGHQLELISDSISENICLGDDIDTDKYLKLCCIYDEIEEFELKSQTKIGSGGVKLSGGQQSRVALARTLAHKKDIVILDDPFSALDKTTEKMIMENLKKELSDNILIIISHRLSLFPSFDNVLWLENGRLTQSTHEKLLLENAEYRKLYEFQNGGAMYEKQ